MCPNDNYIFRTEFRGAFDSHLQAVSVKHIWTSGNQPSKVAPTERAIRSLKMVVRKLRDAGTETQFMPAIRTAVNVLNHSYSRRLRMTPAEVTEATEGAVIQTLLSDQRREDANALIDRHPLAVGSLVRHRLPVKQNQFLKEFEPRFTAESFRVSRHNGPSYYLKTLSGADVPGYWRREDLVESRQTEQEQDPRISERLRTRVQSDTGANEHLVSYKGFPASQSEWISQNRYDQLRGKFKFDKFKQEQQK